MTQLEVKGISLSGYLYGRVVFGVKKYIEHILLKIRIVNIILNIVKSSNTSATIKFQINTTRI